VNNALILLAELGALDEVGQLTDLGRRMTLLPMHPRLSRFLLEAAARRCLGRATVWAALVGERDILFHPPLSCYTRVPDDPYPSDLVVREQALKEAWEMGFDPSACAAIGVQAQACGELARTVELFRKAGRRAGLRASGQGRTEDLIKCLLVAFYDRVALRRDADTLNCAMGGQRRVELDGRSVARQSGALIALEIREQEAGRNRVRTVLSLASAIDVVWLKEVHPHRLEQRVEVAWNSADQAVEQFTTWAYDGLVYHREPERRIDPPAAERLLVEKIQSGELRLERWDEGVRQWLYRVRLLARLFPERDLLAYDEEDIGALLHEIVAGATRYSHLRQRDCLSCIRNALSYPERQFVDLQAPVQLMLPGGGRLKIEYYPDGPPRGRARIQELYGLTQSPRIAAGRQPVLLEILAPNFRPVQVTDDLANFWQITYPQVKKELERRYPKHEWR
jgi:ATP-dependent helicase HrpB